VNQAMNGPGDTDAGRGVREGELPLRDPKVPMHQWEPLSRFSRRADDYAKYRPRYPAAALTVVLEGLGDPTGLVAADVGAGTGISSRWLAYAGLKVYAIEPNAPMREAARPHEKVEWRDGTGEKTGLPDRSVNLVLCAQAFHWFKVEAALAEFARVLKPGGRVALVWNDRVDRDPVTVEYNAILGSFGADVRYQQSKKSSDALAENALFTDYRETIVPNHQDMDLETTIGRTRSISTCPSEGPVWDRIRAELEAWFNRRQKGGKVRLMYDCQVYTATVA
jgi:SAM-dependent methyltransferase